MGYLIVSREIVHFEKVLSLQGLTMSIFLSEPTSFIISESQKDVVTGQRCGLISQCRETKIRHESYSQILLVSFESQEIMKFGVVFHFATTTN